MGEKMQHISVMRDRCIDLLSPSIESSEHPVVVDATLGLGGHSEALLDRFPQLTVIGIDRDPRALAQATERLSRFGYRE
jgi:16S rRNA (cytosine1402-N4)-methyltransferase